MRCRPVVRRVAPLALLILFLPATPSSSATLGGTPEDIFITEVFYLGGLNEDWIEIANLGDTGDVDVGGWWLCSRFDYGQISELTVLVGDTVLSPGERVVLQIDAPGAGDLNDLDDVAADVGLYTVSTFGSSTAMVDFLQYNTADDVGRSDVAADKGIWTETAVGPPPQYDFTEPAAMGESLAYCGAEGGGGLLTLGRDFQSMPPTQGTANAPCEVFDDGFESGDTGAWSATVP